MRLRPVVCILQATMATCMDDHDWAGQPTFQSLGEIGEHLKKMSLRDKNKWNTCICKEIDEAVLKDKSVPPTFCDPKCGCCRIDTISKPKEALCCQHNPLIKPELRSEFTCLTETTRFTKTCIDRDTLILVARNVFADKDQKKALLDDKKILDNHELRYFAYRSFSLTFFGKLPSGERHELPCCVVHKIRSTFCSDTYVGFKLPTKGSNSTGRQKRKTAPFGIVNSESASRSIPNTEIKTNGPSRRKNKVLIDPIVEEYSFDV